MLAGEESKMSQYVRQVEQLGINELQFKITAPLPRAAARSHQFEQSFLSSWSAALDSIFTSQRARPLLFQNS